jgi:hypothetical protein
MTSSLGASNRANRRLSARFACRLTVSYTTGAEWHPATGMDLSSTGCRLRLGEDLGRGHSLRVRFEHAGADGVPLLAELEGTVIWTRLEGLSYQAGAQFTSDHAHLHRILETLGSGPVPTA